MIFFTLGRWLVDICGHDLRVYKISTTSLSALGVGAELWGQVTCGLLGHVGRSHEL